MAENKTKVSHASVRDFLNSIDDPRKKKDCLEIMKIMEAATGAKAKMWGESIVGFGSYHYVYKSGRQGDWMLTGFSPRKANITLYIMPGFDHYRDLLKRLGKHAVGKSCLYIRKLEDIDMRVLKKLVGESVKAMKKSHS